MRAALRVFYILRECEATHSNSNSDSQNQQGRSGASRDRALAATTYYRSPGTPSASPRMRN
ncbi:hypothetical protein LA76x_4011 [Lysobacter antibioticus]|uniref:Uncharacterized protein n=1 Tax=Lysobacter antibioticus TaxID=84531 RepID=A0A0S2FF08_LYSAN|nr:hypothetical protein LA76x_4011 [Lysobacter antibioticus]